MKIFEKRIRGMVIGLGLRVIAGFFQFMISRVAAIFYLSIQTNGRVEVSVEQILF